MTPLWQPAPERMNASKLKHFIDKLDGSGQVSISGYEELYRWSIQNTRSFWRYLLEELGIIFEGNPAKVLSSNDMLDSEWFPEVRLNFAENLLQGRGDKTAIFSVDEKGEKSRLTFDELRDKTYRLVTLLREAGVGEGDRVAGFITNCEEAVIAMLATTALGAIWTSCSPDFGFSGILDRFGQAEPKVLFAVTEYCYSGKIFDCRELVSKLESAMPSVTLTVAVNAPIEDDWVLDCRNRKRFESIEKIEPHKGKLQKFPFDHPLYLLYSSGTTGKPKCIVHGAGGTLLQHWKEHSLHCDINADDIVFYYTTCGWMMWNWLVSCLCQGAAIVLYDGNPAFPRIDTLWKMIDSYGISVFGTSPKFLSACEKMQARPAELFKLDSLQTVLSTGAPLLDHNFNYVYHAVKQDVHLASISGGTDIISCFLLGNPLMPVFSGEIQSAGLGMAVNVFGPDGAPLREAKGELVCELPFPSRPVFFWGDPGKAKYRNAYFSKFPNVWHHGDFVSRTENGGFIVYGRSDATLNPGGVRIGTAEIYRVVESVHEVADSLVIGYRKNGDVSIILFVVLKPGVNLNREFEHKLRMLIKSELTPRHVPAGIFKVPDIPRTLSGKKVEIAVSRLIHGEPLDNIEAIMNPECLPYFKLSESGIQEQTPG